MFYINTHTYIACARCVYNIHIMYTHTHFLKIFYELVYVFFKYKQFRSSGLYTLINYLFFSRDFVSVNRSETGAILRLEVELSLQHKPAR